MSVDPQGESGVARYVGASPEQLSVRSYKFRESSVPRAGWQGFTLPAFG